MSRRLVPLAAAIAVALVVALPAGAKTPPPATVAAVGVQVAKLGVAAAAIDRATAKCTTAACLSKSYSAFYKQAHAVDHSLEALWAAAGKSGPCASAAADAGAGFDSLVGDYHHLEAATLKGNRAAAKAAYAQIAAKTPRLTAIISSLKTKCR